MIMQPRAEEIQRVLTNFVEGGSGGLGGMPRRAFSLVVHGSTPLSAEVRELRGRCAMIDIGPSIFTLAYGDILGIDPLPSAEGGLQITVRPGCFASHAAARLRRAAPPVWHGSEGGRPLARQNSQSDAAQMRARSVDGRSQNFPFDDVEGGTALGGPADNGSAGREVVMDDALRERKK